MKKIVCAVDIGSENMGICRNTNMQKFKTMLSSIHCTSDGRLFKYKEGNIPLLCREWMKTTTPYWKKANLIGFEKQISKTWKEDRVCLLIQNTLEGMFLALHLEFPDLYPKVITPSKAPVHWKKSVGVEIGGGSCREGNKIRGEDRYIEIFGIEEYNKLKAKYEKVDDICESVLQSIYIYENYDTFAGPLFYSGHVEVIGRPGKQIKKEERQIKMLPLFHPSNEYPDPVQLRRNYIEFKDRTNTKTKLRQNTRFLNNLQNLITPITKKRKTKNNLEPTTTKKRKTTNEPTTKKRKTTS